MLIQFFTAIEKVRPARPLAEAPALARVGLSLLVLASTLLSGSLSPIEPAYAAKGVTASTTGPAMKNYKQGVKCNERKDYDGAVDAELQAIYYSRNGYFPDAYYQLGLAYQGKQDYDKAYENLSKACSQAMKPFNEAHLALAQVCTAQKKFLEACGEQAKAYEGLPWGDPLWGRIKYQEAYNLEEWGNLDGAILNYMACEGKWPWKYWWPWIRMNECLMKQKKWSEAYQSFEKMLNQGDLTMKEFDEERVYLDMGICCLGKGNHQGALDNWHKVLSYNPNNKEAHLQLALLLDSEQHLKSAITEYKDFIRNAGEHEEVRVKQVESRISLLEQMQGKVDAPPPPVEPSLYMRQKSERDAAKEQQGGTIEPGF